jgi:hypothetical protein
MPHTNFLELRYGEVHGAVKVCSVPPRGVGPPVERSHSPPRFPLQRMGPRPIASGDGKGAASKMCNTLWSRT